MEKFKASKNNKNNNKIEAIGLSQPTHPTFHRKNPLTSSSSCLLAINSQKQQLIPGTTPLEVTPSGSVRESRIQDRLCPRPGNAGLPGFRNGYLERLLQTFSDLTKGHKVLNKQSSPTLFLWRFGKAPSVFSLDQHRHTDLKPLISLSLALQ